jgi:hypothetical protein
MPGPRTFATLDAALAAPVERGPSQACDTFKHAECQFENLAHEISAGPSKGRWTSTWRCSCACHNQKES